MSTEEGNYVDVLIPMLLTDQEMFLQEFRSGREKANDYSGQRLPVELIITINP